MTSSSDPKDTTAPSAQEMRAVATDAIKHRAEAFRGMAELDRKLATLVPEDFRGKYRVSETFCEQRAKELDTAAVQVERWAEDAERLEQIRRGCRVVYYPPEVGTYPIEHAPLANKDMWAAIMSALDAERNPNLPDAARSSSVSPDSPNSPLPEQSNA